MKPKKIIVLVGVFAVAVGGLTLAIEAVRKERRKREAVKPADLDPSINPRVDPKAEKVKVQTATGYRDVEAEWVNVDAKHLDNFWQYEGGYR